MVTETRRVLSPAYPTSTHDDLRDRVRRLGNQFRADSTSDLLEFIDEISQPGYILGVIREIMSNNDLLQTVARRSYRHVSHFDKIVIVEAEIPNGFRLTAHLWEPPYTEEALSDELIHDHRFSFWSSILVGTLRSRNFLPDERGKNYQKYSYTPENASTENFYAFNGSRKLRSTRQIVEKAGGSYFLSYTTTHKVILPRRETVCTLVLRSPRARSYSNVYNTSYPQTDTSVSNVMFTDSELFSRLARLHSAIDAPRTHRPPSRVVEPMAAPL
jgi:hypothetical protein